MATAPLRSPLTEILRRGEARTLLAQAIEAEVAAYLRLAPTSRTKAGAPVGLTAGEPPGDAADDLIELLAPVVDIAGADGGGDAPSHAGPA